MNNYQIKILSSIDSRFVKEWQNLWKKSDNANLFNSYDWFVTCQNAGEVTHYQVFACYQDKELVAVFPTTSTKCYGINVTVPIGHTFIVDTAFLTKNYDHELLKHLFEKVLQKNVYITTLDEKITTILKLIFPNLFFSLISVNPYVNFENDPLRFFGGSKMRKLNHIIKINQENLEFREYNQNDDLEKQLNVMFEVEQHSAKKQNAKDIFSQEENRQFYINLVRYSKKFVKIFFLYYQNKPIAYGFCLLSGNKLIGYQTSYLAEYAKLSPGKIMVKYLLETLKDKSIEVFDFGGGVSAYKQQFTPDYFFQYNLYHSNNMFIMLWWKSINFARRMKQIVLPEKFTKDHQFLFKTFSQLVATQHQSYAQK